MNRASEHYALIEELAKDAFAKHALEKRADDRGTWWWRCSKPGTGNQAFNVATFPCYVMVWGDLGDAIFQVSDRDSLKWLLMASCRDYALGKVRATDGAKKQFMDGDARDYLDQAEGEAVVDGRASTAKHIRDIRERWGEITDDGEEEGHAWHRAWFDAGDCDPPRCEAWAGSLCWIWEAVKTFRRLHAGHELIAQMTALRTDINQAFEDGDVEKHDELVGRLAVLRVLHEERTAPGDGVEVVLALLGDGVRPPGLPGGAQPGAGDEDGPAEVPR